MSNQYYWHSRISEEKFCRIVRCFADDLTVTETARKVGLTRKSVNNIFLKIRRCICKNYRPFPYLQFPKPKAGKPVFTVASELSVSELEKMGEPVVFCAVYDDKLSVQADIIYTSDPKVFTEFTTELQNTKDPVIHDFGFSDAQFNWIQGLPFTSTNSSLSTESYIKSVERFRKFAARRLKKFKGIRKNMLIYHLKESQWRYNNRYRHPDLFHPWNVDLDFYVGGFKNRYQHPDSFLPLLEMLRKTQI